MPSCSYANAPDSSWNFCPSLPADYLFCALFITTTVVHVIQAIVHRKLYSIVVIIAAAWQAVAFIFRAIAIHKPYSDGPYTIYFILILTGPLWINAYVYMVMGRMVYNFIPDKRLCKIKAWRFGLLFVLLDITAFLVQLGGAAIASGNDSSPNTILLGLHIYMGGIGIQQLFILLFTFLAIKFHLQLLHQPPSPHRSRGLLLLYTLYAVLLLITIRIIFRLIEYSSGLDSSIPNHEAYMYILDSAPMVIALVLFNIVHPGRIMKGKEADFPSRKERKRLGRLMKEGNLGGARGDEELGVVGGYEQVEGVSPMPSPMPKQTTGLVAEEGYVGAGYRGRV
ncbi:MAG: hypothetical protein M1820_004452 [Bogoriella megaspora]|nr:MAG: hypothetical protein M1820_004452 [Bogoriella megaspora]